MASKPSRLSCAPVPKTSCYRTLPWHKEITRVKLRCTGTLYDPKSVTVMRAVIGVLEVVEEHKRLAEEAR